MLDVLLPPRCVLCDRPGGGLCHRCASGLGPPPAEPAPSGLDSLISICSYEGAGKDLVLALKRRNRRAALPLLGAALADVLSDSLADSLSGEHRPDLAGSNGAPTVTWAPTTAQRRRHRGYDQSRLLALAVARPAGLRCVGLLRRTGGPQMGADRQQRQGGAGFAPLGRAPRRVVVLDDVVTSGATMSAAAQTLRESGAVEVRGLALARCASHHGDQ